MLLLGGRFRNFLFGGGEGWVGFELKIEEGWLLSEEAVGALREREGVCGEGGGD